MKIIYGFISLMIITSFALSVLTFFKVRSLNAQVTNLDNLAGQSINNIAGYLNVATTRQQGAPSDFAQYLQSLQVKK